ncbi:MAG: aldo/keto reductase [Spirochaetales bacterium]|nr:aldo/keto reductase [Spirochaetales bacterium]
MNEPAAGRTELADSYSICRIINGGWQLSEGHGSSAQDVEGVINDLDELARKGFTTFDCADIYTGVEDLIGRLRERVAGRGGELQVHTKFVPDRSILGKIDRNYVSTIIDRSLRRLGAERLDLVQFHWWDYDVPGYVQTAGWLADLQKQGKIRHLGVTNFDVTRLRKILAGGVPIVSNQVQYSLLDRRPEHDMISLCRENNILLLCYGSLAGGFLSHQYLGSPPKNGALKNRSLVKYRLIIDEYGGWDEYQGLLSAARQIADKHGVSIPNVAMRYVLEKASVGAVIVGAPSARHADDNLRTFGLSLDDEDRNILDGMTGKAEGVPGEVFGLERAVGGPHRRIMKTDLNRT